MTDSKHKVLSEKCVSQREKYYEWNRIMSAGITQIKGRMEEALGVAGKTWRDLPNEATREYVEVNALGTSGGKSIDLILKEVREDSGEVPFALVVFLEYGEGSYPKMGYRLPVAMRVKDGSVQYAPWDIHNDCEAKSASWADLQTTVDTLIRNLEQHFEFDPLSGPPPKTSIGFVRDGI